MEYMCDILYIVHVRPEDKLPFTSIYIFSLSTTLKKGDVFFPSFSVATRHYRALDLIPCVFYFHHCNEISSDYLRHNLLAVSLHSRNLTINQDIDSVEVLFFFFRTRSEFR